MRIWSLVGVTMGLLGMISPALAQDIYVSPGASLDDALDTASPGDTVYLQAGDHGDLTISASMDADVFIVAEDGAEARTVSFQGASHVVLRGLRVSLSLGTPYESDTMVSIGRGSSHITVEDCDIFSVTDETQATWSAGDWVNLPGTGINVDAPDCTVQRNRVRNVGYGIAVTHRAPNARVLHNLVENFTRDGLRGIGDFGLFEGNLIKNAYDVDDHHDDMFQSWSVGDDGRPGTGVVRGVVIRGNTFINFDDPDQPFAGAAQGIGCFDGFFEDWVIENNVVVVNHWHGITLLGARNTRVVNNTVVDNRLGERPGPPWIEISPHKDGTPSENILFRNNLAQDINLNAQSSTEDHNLGFSDATSVFVSVTGFDFHLLPEVMAIDMGSAEMAPMVDRDGIARPQGAAIDVGAYEWHDGSAMPIDAGTPMGGSDAGSTDPGSDAGSSDTDSGTSAPPSGSDSGSMSSADAGAAPQDAGDTTTSPSDEGGCAAAGAAPSAWLALPLLVALFRRRGAQR